MSRKHIVQYITAAIIAAAMFLTGLASRGIFSPELLQDQSLSELFGTLSDCFLFPAVLLGGVGAMTWISETGSLDMLSYGFYFMFHTLVHPLTPHETYYEYKTRKSTDRGSWLKPWLVTGLICLGFSIVCLLLYLIPYFT